MDVWRRSFIIQRAHIFGKSVASSFATMLAAKRDAKSAWSSRQQIMASTKKKLSCSKQIQEYCAETSLHGPKYITESDNHPVERYFLVQIPILNFAE